MLAKLASSKDAQRLLVQDAGHELRTPLTSLRTNVSLLRRYEQLGRAEHARVLDDLETESRELTTLVNQLIELATTEDHGDQPKQEVSLRSIIEPAVDRARRRTGRTIVLTADDSVVCGQPQALERAVANLLDNAAKFAEGDDAIEVCSELGRITVSDRGPGFDDDDLNRVFDRFYRATNMRGHPGSGLGLSIVKNVAEMHGGTVAAANRPGGGALVTIELPIVRTAILAPAPAGDGRDVEETIAVTG
jgi:two-component system sensor histidine kinase MprB